MLKLEKGLTGDQSKGKLGRGKRGKRVQTDGGQEGKGRVPAGDGAGDSA